MHCFVFLSLLSHYSTAVFTRVPFFDRKAKGVKGLGPFSDLCPYFKKIQYSIPLVHMFLAAGTINISTKWSASLQLE